MDTNNLIDFFFEKKMLLNKEVLSSELNEELIKTVSFSPPQFLILNKDNFILLEKNIDWFEYDKNRVVFEKENKINISFNTIIPKNNFFTNNLKLISLPTPIPQKHEISDFTSIFISRYRFLEKLLRNRQELSGTLSIIKVLSKKERENVSIIGMVREKRQTKNDSIIINLEDLTGQVNVIINKNKKEIYNYAKDLVLDEVVGITGTIQNGVIFIESIVWPEVPADKELKKHPEEIYAVFISDVHVGSANFLESEFLKFLDWLGGKIGTDNQKEIAKKVAYIFIIGDLVDGVGIYPDQDKELIIKDIFQQYKVAAELLLKIPPHIKIIICPGNHDALPLAEPQTAFNPKYTSPLTELPNVLLVSNPALINIGQTDNFSGLDILMYHGYSFDYYVANVDSIRSSGGYSRADLIMKFLLRRRHLAPTFTSTPYFPSPEDHLLIKKIPDFLITGHIHYSSVANYRGITLISGSCWQSKTNFQEKVGHEPQPARVPIVNLKTREIKIMKFI